MKKPKKTKKSKKQKRSKKRRKNKNNRRKGARSRRDASGDVIEDSTSFNMTSLEYYDDNMTSQYSVRDDSPMRSVDEWNFTKSYFCQNPSEIQSIIIYFLLFIILYYFILYFNLLYFILFDINKFGVKYS